MFYEWQVPDCLPRELVSSRAALVCRRLHAYVSLSYGCVVIARFGVVRTENHIANEKKMHCFLYFGYSFGAGVNPMKSSPSISGGRIVLTFVVGKCAWASLIGEHVSSILLTAGRFKSLIFLMNGRVILTNFCR